MDVIQAALVPTGDWGAQLEAELALYRTLKSSTLNSNCNIEVHFAQLRAHDALRSYKRGWRSTTKIARLSIICITMSKYFRRFYHKIQDIFWFLPDTNPQSQHMFT